MPARLLRARHRASVAICMRAGCAQHACTAAKWRLRATGKQNAKTFLEYRWKIIQLSSICLRTLFYIIHRRAENIEHFLKNFYIQIKEILLLRPDYFCNLCLVQRREKSHKVFLASSEISNCQRDDHLTQRVSSVESKTNDPANVSNRLVSYSKKHLHRIVRRRGADFLRKISDTRFHGRPSAWYYTFVALISSVSFFFSILIYSMRYCWENIFLMIVSGGAVPSLLSKEDISFVFIFTAAIRL